MISLQNSFISLQNTPCHLVMPFPGVFEMRRAHTNKSPGHALPPIREKKTLGGGPGDHGACVEETPFIEVFSGHGGHRINMLLERGEFTAMIRVERRPRKCKASHFEASSLYYFNIAYAQKCVMLNKNEKKKRYGMVSWKLAAQGPGFASAFDQAKVSILMSWLHTTHRMIRVSYIVTRKSVPFSRENHVREVKCPFSLGCTVLHCGCLVMFTPPHSNRQNHESVAIASGGREPTPATIISVVAGRQSPIVVFKGERLNYIACWAVGGGPLHP